MNQVREVAWVHWHACVKIKDIRDRKSNPIDLLPPLLSLADDKDGQEQGP